MLKVKITLCVCLLCALPAVSRGQAPGGKEIRKTYYPGGAVRTVCQYNALGKRDGTCRTYDKGGNLFILKTFSNGRCTGKKLYYSNGRLKRTYAYKNGKPNGQSRGYYESGRVAFVVNFVNGKADGPSTGLYESGMLKSEMHYKDGKANGRFRQYYESGKLRFETIYREGKVIAPWTEYTESGELKERNPVEF